jgi:fermentation-respiration switch protein FrsA (DUF1100 family)
VFRPIAFQSQGDSLAGLLVLPDGPARPRPALVVTGAWFTVKEQMPLRYARELAARGYAALVFDFRGFGQSAGDLRQRETPAMKIEDVRAAAACLGRLPEVDQARVGALAICASAGYAARAAADATDLLRAVAFVAPWFQDRGIVEAVYGGADGVQALLQVGARARAEQAATGRQQFVPAASLDDPRALMFGVPYYTEPHRGRIPAWRNDADLAFWPDWLGFDSLSAAPELRSPLALVHSEAAAVPQGAHAFFEQVRAPKRELWLDGVSQFDFYDSDRAVQAACDFAAAHFSEHL